MEDGHEWTGTDAGSARSRARTEDAARKPITSCVVVHDGPDAETLGGKGRRMKSDDAALLVLLRGRNQGKCPSLVYATV